MDFTFLSQAAQLGGTVFTVVIFVRYITTRDKEANESSIRQTKSNLILGRALQKLTDMVEINTGESHKNTVSIGKSKSAIDKNTDVIDKNTEVIGINGNKEKTVMVNITEKKK